MLHLLLAVPYLSIVCLPDWLDHELAGNGIGRRARGERGSGEERTWLGATGRQTQDGGEPSIGSRPHADASDAHDEASGRQGSALTPRLSRCAHGGESACRSEERWRQESVRSRRRERDRREQERDKVETRSGRGEGAARPRELTFDVSLPGERAHVRTTSQHGGSAQSLRFRPGRGHLAFPRGLADALAGKSGRSFLFAGRKKGTSALRGCSKWPVAWVSFVWKRFQRECPAQGLSRKWRG